MDSRKIHGLQNLLSGDSAHAMGMIKFARHWPKKDNAVEMYIRYVTNHAVPKTMTLADVKAATQLDTHIQWLT